MVNYQVCCYKKLKLLVRRNLAVCKSELVSLYSKNYDLFIIL